MGAMNSACQGCFGASEEESTSGSHIVFRAKKHNLQEATDDSIDKGKLNANKETELENNTPAPSSNVSTHVHHNLSLEDFEIVRTLGKGSFGKVYLVQKKVGKKLYALKALKKKDLLRKNLLQCTLNEKNILKEMEHPFVVQLKYSFQSNSNVYMVMDYCTGGDLNERLKKDKKFDEKTVKYSAAEIVLALQYVHEKLNIIHRDIKPENILIAADGHLKITDFGIAKTTKKAITLCGTPEYLAPEIILGCSYGQEVDWWSLGCLIYQLLTGQPPFTNERKDKLVENIMTQEPSMPETFSSPLKDLLLKLLDKDPKKRLGAKGAKEIKEHQFFKGIDWNAMMAKQLPPPFKLTPDQPETGHHTKQLSNASVLLLKSQNSANYDFPQFTYASKDVLADDNEETPGKENKA